MSTNTNVARSPARSSSNTKTPRRSTPGSVTKKSGAPGNSRNGRRRSDQRRALELFGEEPGALFDGLVARVGGGIMDCTDALEVSAHEAGVSEGAASEAISSILETLRADLAPRLVAFRAYALRNVFKLPPASDEERLDKQLVLCAERLHDARSRSREIERASRTIQKRITTLENNHSAVQTTLLRACEKEGTDITKLAHDVMRDVNEILPAGERKVIGDITASSLEGEDDGTLKLGSKKAALPMISAVFEPHPDEEDVTIAVDEQGGGIEESVMKALSLLEGCPQKAK